MTILLLVLALQTPTEEPKVDYVETINVVRLTMKVKENGKPFKGLRLQDVRVLENGNAIPLQSLQQVDTPLTLHFLFSML